ncbi:hypothetical protein VN97_g5479 [Penicillium thymicola]|uniref:Cupin type-2 domain-containing protein n=1 Tax=Penicillium thymicola TaxID=293382 RepID=A0AAI9X959_PENTH|nr:hypothetical protein VN97_g5479 [Penicillium thymicola]
MSSSPLPPIRRIVTSHNTRAQATIAYDTAIPSKIQPHGVGEALLWSTDTIPADVTSPVDKATAQVGFTNGGSIFRIVDLPPQSVGGLHRTISLDYVVVLKGAVVLTLDDGTRIEVGQGDVVVQQASMHGWDNERDEWARLLCVMAPADTPVFGGKSLDSDLRFLS